MKTKPFSIGHQTQVHVPMPQTNQPTNQQTLTPMQQQQQAPAQPQQTAHPGYSGMFFDDVGMSHHSAPKEAVKPTVKDSQLNVVHGNAGMQMPHPHPYAVPQQHTQQTAPAQPAYKQPQAASSQSKQFNQTSNFIEVISPSKQKSQRMKMILVNSV